MDYEISQNEGTAALRRVAFFLPDSSDGFTPRTGQAGNLSARVSKNGGTTAAGAGSFTEIDAANMPGMYYYQCAAGETDTEGWLLLVFTCTGAVPQRVTVRVGSSNRDIGTQLVTVQADLDNPSQYMADVSALAIEANVQGHAADALTAYDPPTRAEAAADRNAVEAAIAAAEGNVRGADGDDLKMLSDEIDAVPTVVEIDARLSATHGGDSWEDVKGPGEGANPVTVTIRDAATNNVVPGVVVHVRNEDETVLLRLRVTTSGGRAEFLLDDGTYKVRMYKTGVYTFEQPQTLVVNGTTAATYTGSRIYADTPVDPSSSASGICRSVVLHQKEIKQYIRGRTQGYLFELAVVEAVNIDKEIFVYQRKPGTDGPRDEFSNVASPADLEEYPVGEPAPDGVFYRTAEVSLVYRDIELMQQGLADVKSDIAGLVEALNKMDRFTESTVTIT